MNSYHHNNSNKSVNTSTEQKSQTISKASSETPYSQLPYTHAKILQLQKTIGNRAVEQLMKMYLQPQRELQNEASKDARQYKKKGNRTGMPDNLKSGIESLSGIDLSDVNVRYNSSRPKAFNALAYAQGSEIHLGEGEGQEQHLPHEAWHIVQQRQGRVKATTQHNGIPINDDGGLEREADRMGNRAASFSSPRDMTPNREVHSCGEASSCSQLQEISSNMLGPVQMIGWKPEELFEYLKSKKIAGLCNSLSAAWLTRLIAPDNGDLGVDQQIIEKIELLKQLLDAVIYHFSEYDSREITFAFIDYFRGKLTSDWLDGLTKGNVEDEFDSFKEYVDDDWHPDQKGIIEVATEGKYEELTKEKLYKMIDGALEPFFSMNEPFYGIVVLGADMRSDTEEYDYESFKGHQFAIRYTPDNNYLFEIYDQNRGLAPENISEQEQIAEILTDHLHDGYISNPIGGTNYAKISITINKKG